MDSVWFDYTATSAGALEVDVTGGGGSAGLAVFTGARGAVTRAPGTTCWSSWDDAALLQTTAGTTYHFMVVVNAWWSGSARITVGEVLPPANDDFADATPIATVPATGETRLGAATGEPGEPDPTCAGRTGPTPSAWFAFTAPRTESITFDRTSDDYDTTIAVYTGTPSAR